MADSFTPLRQFNYANQVNPIFICIKQSARDNGIGYRDPFSFPNVGLFGLGFDPAGTTNVVVALHILEARIALERVAQKKLGKSKAVFLSELLGVPNWTDDFPGAITVTQNFPTATTVESDANAMATFRRLPEKNVWYEELQSACDRLKGQPDTDTGTFSYDLSYGELGCIPFGTAFDLDVTFHNRTAGFNIVNVRFPDVVRRSSESFFADRPGGLEQFSVSGPITGTAQLIDFGGGVFGGAMSGQADCTVRRADSTAVGTASGPVSGKITSASINPSTGLLAPGGTVNGSVTGGITLPNGGGSWPVNGDVAGLCSVVGIGPDGSGGFRGSLTGIASGVVDASTFAQGPISVGFNGRTFFVTRSQWTKVTIRTTNSTSSTSGTVSGDITGIPSENGGCPNSGCIGTVQNGVLKDASGTVIGSVTGEITILTPSGQSFQQNVPISGTLKGKLNGTTEIISTVTVTKTNTPLGTGTFTGLASTIVNTVYINPKPGPNSNYFTGMSLIEEATGKVVPGPPIPPHSDAIFHFTGTIAAATDLSEAEKKQIEALGFLRFQLGDTISPVTSIDVAQISDPRFLQQTLVNLPANITGPLFSINRNCIPCPPCPTMNPGDPPIDIKDSTGKVCRTCQAPGSTPPPPGEIQITIDSLPGFKTCQPGSGVGFVTIKNTRPTPTPPAASNSNDITVFKLVVTPGSSLVHVDKIEPNVPTLVPAGTSKVFKIFFSFFRNEPLQPGESPSVPITVIVLENDEVLIPKDTLKAFGFINITEGCVGGSGPPDCPQCPPNRPPGSPAFDIKDSTGRVCRTCPALPAFGNLPCPDCPPMQPGDPIILIKDSSGQICRTCVPPPKSPCECPPRPDCTPPFFVSADCPQCRYPCPGKDDGGGVAPMRFGFTVDTSYVVWSFDSNRPDVVHPNVQGRVQIFPHDSNFPGFSSQDDSVRIAYTFANPWGFPIDVNFTAANIMLTSPFGEDFTYAFVIKPITPTLVHIPANAGDTSVPSPVAIFELTLIAKPDDPSADNPNNPNGIGIIQIDAKDVVGKIVGPVGVGDQLWGPANLPTCNGFGSWAQGCVIEADQGSRGGLVGSPGVFEVIYKTPTYDNTTGDFAIVSSRANPSSSIVGQPASGGNTLDFTITYAVKNKAFDPLQVVTVVPRLISENTGKEVTKQFQVGPVSPALPVTIAAGATQNFTIRVTSQSNLNQTTQFIDLEGAVGGLYPSRGVDWVRNVESLGFYAITVQPTDFVMSISSSNTTFTVTPADIARGFGSWAATWTISVTNNRPPIPGFPLATDSVKFRAQQVSGPANIADFSGGDINFTGVKKGSTVTRTFNNSGSFLIPPQSGSILFRITGVPQQPSGTTASSNSVIVQLTKP